MSSNTLNDFNIDEKNLQIVSEWAKDFAVSKGILMRTRDHTKDTRVPLPFCLVPSKIPQKWYHLVSKLQPYINEVLFKISYSREFLKTCFASTIEADEFTANIFRIYEAVENQSKQLSLGLIRSDYLLNTDPSGNVTGIKQVENNTIAASFGGLAPNVADLHRYILKRLGKESFLSKNPDVFFLPEVNDQALEVIVHNLKEGLNFKFLAAEHNVPHLPINNSVNELAKGLISAWDKYGNPSACILFVVEESTLNICDQKAVEHAIVECNSSIEILRYSFKDLRNLAKLNEEVLFVGNKEIAVVYYRTGYMPEDYEKQDWDTRLLMEQSCAVKCPSAGLHLAGSKRVQSLLTYPGVLEKFISPDKAEELRQVFASQYTLSKGSEGDKAISFGIENPSRYVLKPEREGGGNNIYGDEIKTVLESIKATNKRDAYILMERINPPFIPNCIVVRDKPPLIQTVICELGIFGVVLGNQNEINVNVIGGHLLRSKESFRDETGVAAGFGALDSPLLT